ncbi:hypothetical protein ACFVY4_26815 [Streptomyces sp. NPDC058299]|uniref:hypothetical protein n=1 Tax=Streptomyces sp. NPDC058299 TaxID=3346435 RepID=UPI0036E3786C
MARPKKHPAQTDLLAESAEFLDEAGKPDHAKAVREVLSDLTRSRAREDNPTLSLWTYRETWRAAQDDCEKRGRSIPDLVEDGFAAFLAGRFKPKKAQRASGGAKGQFSARASAERRQEVAAYVAAHAESLGWSPSPQQVAAAWLEHKYGPYKRT